MLVGRVLEIGGGTQQRERLVVLALGACEPRGRRAALDLDLRRPVESLLPLQSLFNRGQPRDRLARRRDIAAARAADRACELNERFVVRILRPRERRWSRRDRRGFFPRPALERVPGGNRSERVAGLERRLVG